MSRPSPKNTDHTRKHPIEWPVIIAIGMVLLSSLIYLPGIYQALGAFAVLIIYDVCVVAFALTAAVLAALLWRTFDPGETLSLIWGTIAIGLTAWAIGEIIWSSDQIWGGNSLPYPSAADLLWILGYLPIIWALILRYRTLRTGLRNWWQIVALTGYGLVVILTMIYIVAPIVTDTDTTRVYEKTVNLLYPVGDLAIAYLSTALMLVLIGGTLFSSWGLISFGFVCAAVSDLLYAMTLWQGIYQVSPVEGVDFVSFVINLLYVAFYAFVALGLYRQAKILNVI